MEIQGYSNYLIYPDGRVFSKKRKDVSRSNRFLKPYLRKGYLRLALTNHKGRKNHSINRLVADHYIRNPYNYKEVDHIDRNPLNNDISNLRWVNRSTNCHNKGIIKTNKSGYKNISFRADQNMWIFKYKSQNIKTIYKRFKTKTEAICYKYIFTLRIRAGHFN